ncbi:DUF4082 domain-containing protein [Azohydromonas australica]|uniref:DUF4082 domain-containing protein n=1 Tax=Azohydromonas australica TaxID=364039 RepID=UPI00040276D1|nr:DUF4082 domain-containing protein [Azohydromonas australica]
MLHGHGARARGAREFLLLVAACCAVLLCWARPAQAANPAQGPGGAILVVTAGNTNFGTYYAEILRNEGFNAFAVADVSTLSSSTLVAYDVVILAKTALSSSQVTTLANWVNGGGNLIAMAPDVKLAGLLGLSSAAGTLSNRYLLVSTANGPGSGIVNQTMQFHGSAGLYNLAGATGLATLYSNATTPTPYPAVTWRSVGSGKAAAFTFDLATSIVYTRQGNPAWATQERDGFTPIRSDDKFFGNAAANPQPDWVDLSKVAIPQADEQQRLLANLITQMNLTKKPLPRFWYFPRGHKAVVIMSGDDHANGGTAGRFDRFKALSPAGCSVANWECVRGTSYIYPGTPLTNQQAAQYNADGFEVGLHVNTSCNDFTAASLDSTYASQLSQWQSKYSSLPAPSTQRHHCIVWSDWASGAQVQAKYGMRLDTSYYFWPPGWVNNVPGLFTGSAMPMRFMRLDGAFIDVYQAVTQMTDESGQQYPLTVDRLLDRAVGPEGFYGVYTVNAHTDQVSSAEAEAVVASARARGVPVVSSRQMLAWLDARNDSTFSSMSWSGSALRFSVSRSPNANGLQGMLPRRAGSGVLLALTRAGTAVPFTIKVVKGMEHAFFAADTGTYVASYGADSTAPAVTATVPTAGATNVSTSTVVTARFSETMDPVSINASTFELRNAANNALVSASVSYDATSQTATLRPAALLAGSTSYKATLHGGSTEPRIRDAAGNVLAADFPWSFTTAAAPVCPCSGWSGTATPTNPSDPDPGAVELGVKFRVDTDGFITGIRFYKGTGNTGTHVANLWSLDGRRLATAQFVNETASGWQQVSFSTPVPVSANTIYVASYFAPNGHYAGDNNFFSTKGVDSGPVHLLQNGLSDSGGNGVYAYGTSSSYPSQTYLASNYWVDVVFKP